MTTLRNIVLTVICAALMFSAIAAQVFLCIVPDAPLPRTSNVEGRDYVQMSDLAELSIAEGEFQTQFEQYAADSVPIKESLVQLSADLQRSQITIAAKSLGFNIYPTVFDSEYDIVEDEGLVVQEPTAAPRAKSRVERDLKTWTETLNEAAKSHPDTRFLVNIVLQVKQDDSNPPYDLFTSFEKMNAEWAQSAWADRLDDSMTVFIDDVADAEEVRTEWYATDHHWTLKRALDSYNRIAAALGLKSAEWSDEHAFTPVPEWFGSYTRQGLYFGLTSTLVDQDRDFSHLRHYELKGGEPADEIDLGLRDGIVAGTASPDQVAKYNAYSDYFGNKQTVTINEGPNNGKTCLLVGDSMSSTLRRYIEDNYATTVTVLPGNIRTDKTLTWFIDRYDADDVIVLSHAYASYWIADRSPKFLGGDSQK